MAPHHAHPDGSYLSDAVALLGFGARRSSYPAHFPLSAQVGVISPISGTNGTVAAMCVCVC